MPKKPKRKQPAPPPKKPIALIIRQGEDAHVSHEDYYDVTDGTEADPTAAQINTKKDASAKKATSPALNPKALLITAGILLVAALAVLVFLNRNNFSPDNFGLWFRTKLMGTGVGDGYPVSITGSTVSSGNFLDFEGNCAILSDTTFTILNGTGKEQLSFRHSYNTPALVQAQGRFMLYNAGGTGYALTTANNVEKRVSTDKITSGALAKNGRYALITQPSDFASKLSVYLPGGTEKFRYQLADAYMTAVALNADGSKGVVAAVESENGKLYSTIYGYDFNQTEPVFSYRTENNLITHLSYHSSGAIYAVGDKSTLHFDGKESFTTYSYSGKSVTAVSVEDAAVLISISGYARGGPCTVLAFTGDATPTEIPTQTFVSAISSYGNSFAVLTENQVASYQYSGELLGTSAAGYDAKGICLANERDVYILGVREIRFSTIGLPPTPTATAPPTALQE